MAAYAASDWPDNCDNPLLSAIGATMFGLDAPCWMCITGPNWRDERYDHHELKAKPSHSTKPIPCIAISPEGVRHECKSLGQAAIVMGGCSHDSRNFRKYILKQGFYRAYTGWRVVLA